MDILNNKDNMWKNKNQQYLFELQKFLDLVDNVEDEELKKQIIGQMLKCDRCVTKIAEDIFLEKKINKECD
jgi:hypothetical protein